MSFPQLDDSEEWLRSNDPLYCKKNRATILEYSYHTNTQTRYRDCREIPESALSFKQQTNLHCYDSRREVT